MKKWKDIEHKKNNSIPPVVKHPTHPQDAKLRDPSYEELAERVDLLNKAIGYVGQLKPLTVEKVDDWLANQHVTLWQSWDVTKPARRRLAAEWVLALYQTMKELEQS